jgi:tetratricopeptide (TPR) repeat protein
MNYFSTVLFLMCFYFNGFSQQVLTKNDLPVQEKLIDSKKWALLGNYEKSLTGFLALAKDTKDNPLVCYEIGRIYDILNQWDLAQEWALKAYKGEPSNLWYTNFLVDLYEKNNKLNDAITLVNELTSQFPTNRTYLDKKLYLQLKANKKEDAIGTAYLLYKNFGRQITDLQTKTQLQIDLNQIKKAEQDLVNEIKSNPSQINLRHLLADFYTKTNQKNKADEVFKEIVSLFPSDPTAKLALLKSESNGMFNEFEPLFKDLEVGLDDKIRLLIPIVQKALDQKDFATGESLFNLIQILFDKYPPSAKLYALAGDIEQIRQNFSPAIKWYSKSIALEPGIFSVWEMLLYLQLKEGQITNLKKSASNALDYFPFHQKIYFLKSLSHTKSEDWDEALFWLEEINLFAVPELPIDLLKSFVFIQKNDLQKAAQVLELLSSKFPDNREIRAQLAYLSSLQGKFQEAQKLTDILLSDKSPITSAYFFAAHAWFLSKNFQKAHQFLDVYLESNLFDYYAEALELKGNIYLEQGDRFNAVKLWQKSLEKGRESPLLIEKINQYAP